MMKENQVKKGNYTAPKIEIISVKTTCHILDTSYPGQHKPANPGTPPEEEDPENGAKRSLFFEEENSSFWND